MAFTLQPWQAGSIDTSRRRSTSCGRRTASFSGSWAIDGSGSRMTNGVGSPSPPGCERPVDGRSRVVRFV